VNYSYPKWIGALRPKYKIKKEGTKMKRFNDLSKDEIYNLSQEEVNRYIDIECAMQGIGLMPEQPVKPEVKEYPKDAMIYFIKDLKVTTLEEANMILNILNQVNLVDTTYKNCDSSCTFILNNNDEGEI
jgi:hypothetical protein